jgi:signal peptidase II
MNKTRAGFIAFTFICLWLADRFTKHFAGIYLNSFIDFGFFHFSVFHNHGLILGSLTDLSPLLRLVCLSTLGMFIFSIYLIILYLLPKQTLLLKIGLTILVSGILGNVYDKIIWGYAVDFISFRFSNLQSPIFNLADVFQWIGFLLISFVLFIDRSILWHPEDVRNQFWVNKKFQLKYSLILVSVGICLSLIGWAFSYSFFKSALLDITGDASALRFKKHLDLFSVLYVLICCIFCFILFIVGKLISHRIAGPLYAFEKFLDDVLEGKSRNFKLRVGDEFQHLEEKSEKIKARLINK